MLSREDTELLCRVGAGTPMGELMRRYWMPVAYTTEVLADGQPQRVRVLGEDLILWRDTAGTPSFVQDRCPHRGGAKPPPADHRRGVRTGGDGAGGADRPGAQPGGGVREERTSSMALLRRGVAVTGPVILGPPSRVAVGRDLEIGRLTPGPLVVEPLQIGHAPVAAGSRPQTITQLGGHGRTLAVHEVDELPQAHPMAQTDVIVRKHERKRLAISDQGPAR